MREKLVMQEVLWSKAAIKKNEYNNKNQKQITNNQTHYRTEVW